MNLVTDELQIRIADPLCHHTSESGNVWVVWFKLTIIAKNEDLYCYAGSFVLTVISEVLNKCGAQD